MGTRRGVRATVKTSFVLYHDLREPLELLSDEERGRLLSAIFEYSMTGALPEFSGALQLAFAFVRTALDRDAAAWEDKVQKRREAGRAGGRRTQARRANAAFACSGEANEAEPDPEPDPEYDPEPEHERDPEPEPEGGPKAEKAPGRPAGASRFKPPEAEEVKAYVLSRGSAVDPQRFVDYYAARGWMIGRAKMKDWRAAVRTWERSGDARGRPGAALPSDAEYMEGWT